MAVTCAIQENYVLSWCMVLLHTNTIVLQMYCYKGNCIPNNPMPKNMRFANSIHISDCGRITGIHVPFMTLLKQKEHKDTYKAHKQYCQYQYNTK